MPIAFKKAIRQDIKLLIGLAGGTGSGKTYSALRIASSLAEGNPFGFIDTENGRALHYADEFRFDHAEIREPFTPMAYEKAIIEGAKHYDVLVVDSASHEHAGYGGLLDWHDEEWGKRGRRESTKMLAWIEPKKAHKRMVWALLSQPAHIILCFRAEPKIEMVKDKNGKMEVREKQSPIGYNGWMPISEKGLPFELTLSIMLSANNPGIPYPIKMPEKLKSIFPKNKLITEDCGKKLAEYAAGKKTRTASKIKDDGNHKPDTELAEEDITWEAK
jgi:hypothetical protein